MLTAWPSAAAAANPACRLDGLFMRAYTTHTEEEEADAVCAVYCLVLHCRTAAGTNTGPIRNQPPSGARVQFSGVTLMRFNAAGQIQQSIVFRCVVGR